MKAFFIFMTFIMSISVFGQNKKNGYIVTLSQDTIFGKISGQNISGITCKFQNSNGEIFDYKPNEIAVFGYAKGNVYASKEIDGKTVFVEYLVKGDLNLYSLKNEKKRRYFVENQIDSLAEIKLEYETVIGETSMKLHKLLPRHIELLTKYTAQTPSLQRKIKKIDLIEENILVEIAEKHNKNVCGAKKCEDECCKVFRDNSLQFGFELNPTFGFNAFDAHDLTFTIGVVGYFKLPKTNNKLFVKTGFLYSKITKIQTITKQKGFVQFPIQVEARYSFKYFRPKAALGVSFTSLKHFGDFYTTMFSFGTDIFLTKKIYASLNYDIHCEPLFLIIPWRFQAHTLLFGVNFVF